MKNIITEFLSPSLSFYKTSLLSLYNFLLLAISALWQQCHWFDHITIFMASKLTFVLIKIFPSKQFPLFSTTCSTHSFSITTSNCSSFVSENHCHIFSRSSSIRTNNWRLTLNSTKINLTNENHNNKRKPENKQTNKPSIDIMVDPQNLWGTKLVPWQNQTLT